MNPVTTNAAVRVMPAAGYAPRYLPNPDTHRAYGTLEDAANAVPPVVYGVLAVAGAALARGPLKKVIAGTATPTDVLTFAGAAIVGSLAVSRVWKSNA